MLNSESFSGKRALITGGAKRLGRETALALGQAGVRLAIHYHSSQGPAEAFCRELQAQGISAFSIQANLEDPVAVEALFTQTWEELEGLDFLVNNASIFPEGLLETMELHHLHETLGVNAWAPFLLIRAFWKRIRGTEKTGSVVNLLDTRLVGGDLAHAPYHLSKATLRELTTLTALEFSPELQVNGVAPGAVLPPDGLGDDHLDGLVAGLPLKRRGYPKDITDAILYLLSASFVTGQIIFVDGGRHIRLGGTT